MLVHCNIKWVPRFISIVFNTCYFAEKKKSLRHSQLRQNYTCSINVVYCHLSKCDTIKHKNMFTSEWSKNVS